MNWLDIILIIGLIGSAFLGLRQGIVKGLCALAGIFLGPVLAGRFYPSVAPMLTTLFDEEAANLAAFLLIILVVLVLAYILGRILSAIFTHVTSGMLDHILGAVFGLTVGAILLSAILAAISKFIGGEFISGSAIAQVLLDKFPLILGLLPPEFDSIKEFFSS